MTLLGLVIVWVDFGSQFLFLDDGLLLVLARLAEFLCRLVFELSVVHDLAHRGPCLGGYFDEIEIGIRSHAKGVFDAHDAHLLPAGSDESDLRYSDALVDAGLSADAASLVRSFGPTARWRTTGNNNGAHHTTSTLFYRTERPCSKQGPCRPIATKSPAYAAERTPEGVRDRTA